MAKPAGDSEYNAQVTAELNERLRTVEKMMRENAPTDDIARFLYWPDTVVATEGIEKVYRSFPEFLVMFGEVVDGELSRDGSWSTLDPVLVSGDLAVALYQVTFRFPDGREDLCSRAVYTWQKRDADWKVAMELAGMGTID